MEDHKKNSIQLNRDEDSKTLEITVSGYIGYDFSAASVITAISNWYKDYHIKLNIFSGGGSYLEALALYEYFKDVGVNSTAYIYGLAGSAATIIATACQEIHIGENSEYFIHRAQSVSGDATQKEMDYANETIVSIYRKKTGLSAARIKSLLDKGDEGEIITAQEAKELGLVDNVFKTTSKKVTNNKIESIAAYKKIHGVAPNIENAKDMDFEKKYNDLKNGISKMLGMKADDIEKGLPDIDLTNVAAMQGEITALKNKLESMPSITGSDLENYQLKTESLTLDQVTDLINKQKESYLTKADLPEDKTDAIENLQTEIAELKANAALGGTPGASKGGDPDLSDIQNAKKAVEERMAAANAAARKQREELKNKK